MHASERSLVIALLLIVFTIISVIVFSIKQRPPTIITVEEIRDVIPRYKVEFLPLKNITHNLIIFNTNDLIKDADVEPEDTIIKFCNYVEISLNKYAKITCFRYLPLFYSNNLNLSLNLAVLEGTIDFTIELIMGSSAAENVIIYLKTFKDIRENSTLIFSDNISLRPFYTSGFINNSIPALTIKLVIYSSETSKARIAINTLEVSAYSDRGFQTIIFEVYDALNETIDEWIYKAFQLHVLDFWLGIEYNLVFSFEEKILCYAFKIWYPWNTRIYLESGIPFHGELKFLLYGTGMVIETIFSRIIHISEENCSKLFGILRLYLPLLRIYINGYALNQRALSRIYVKFSLIMINSYAYFGSGTLNRLLTIEYLLVMPGNYTVKVYIIDEQGTTSQSASIIVDKIIKISISVLAISIFNRLLDIRTFLMLITCIVLWSLLLVKELKIHRFISKKLKH